jgi:hypothetical protein
MVGLDAELYSGWIRELSIDAILNGTLTREINIDGLLHKEGMGRTTYMDIILYAALTTSTGKWAIKAKIGRPTLTAKIARPSFKFNG